MDPYTEKQNTQVKPRKCIASCLYIMDRSMSWPSHNKLPFAKTASLGFLCRKCQWKVLTNVHGKLKHSTDIFEKSQNYLYCLTDHIPKNHGSVSWVSLAISTDTRQTENLSGEKAVLSPSLCVATQKFHSSPVLLVGVHTALPVWTHIF